MERIAHYLDADQAADALRALGAEIGATEFALVRNLNYVFAPREIYPLAPRVAPPLERIAAFAVDMDGTSTTTEPLALHSLETMVRRLTGRMACEQWPGLDPRLDVPYVIGNSNFRHTEFLVQRYRDCIDADGLRRAFFEAVAWTLANMTDPQRRRDVQQDARNCGLGDLLADADFVRLVGAPAPLDDLALRVAPFERRYGPAFRCAHDAELVSAALDVYYARYHHILQQIEQGQADRLAAELLGQSGRRLIEPMPAYDLFVALTKGWLGPDADALYEMLRSQLLSQPNLGHTPAELDAWRPRLRRLGEHFERSPAKLGLVTASIAYETHAVMKEVVRVIARRAADWPISASRRDLLAERLADYRAVFDAFVCASDTWEARLKPHRDLYSLALYQMSIPRSEYSFCVGLEDTEPGVIALRAAGIGCAVALPNHDTSRQDYSAAAAVVRGGLPELVLARNLFLAESRSA